MSVIANTASPQAHGRKRPREDHSPYGIDADQDFDLLISGPPKRSAFYSYWDALERSSSPLTPESGITDMSSPPCAGAGTMELQESLVASPSVATQSGSVIVPISPGSSVTSAIGGLVPVSSASPQPRQSKQGFFLRIVDQPEENYRARYDSEGCRGPMKGRSGGYPTVEIIAEPGRKWYGGGVRVELVGSDSIPLHSCLLDGADPRNLNKKLHPSEGANKVSFENLRIRRLKKQDTKATRSSASGDGSSVKGGKGGTKSKQDEKVAYLLFTADISTEKNNRVELQVKSEAIYLNANHDPPEIHRIVPAYGSCQGREQVVIVGTRMHSAKVSFLITGADGTEHELIGDIDKEISHQNALVVHIPQVHRQWMNSQSILAQVVVTAGKGDRGGKDPLRSSPYWFTYVAQDTCKECFMKKLNMVGNPGGHMCLFPPNLAPHHLFTPGPSILPQSLHGMHQPHMMMKSSPPPMMPRAPRHTQTIPATDYNPTVSSATTDDHLRGLLTNSKLSPPPVVSSAAQDSMLELFQDTSVAGSPPLSANSTHSLDIPVPTTCAQVSLLEPSITEVMSSSFPISDPSGPVSPEEMSQYLNEVCHPPTALPLAPHQEYPPISSSGFVTESLLACKSRLPNNA